MAVIEDPLGGHGGIVAWIFGAIAGAAIFVLTVVAALRGWVRGEAGAVADERIASHDEDENAHPNAIEKATGPVMTVLERIESKLNRLELKVTRLATSHDILTNGGQRSCVDQDSGDIEPAFGDVPLTRRQGDPSDFDPRTLRRSGGVRGRS